MLGEIKVKGEEPDVGVPLFRIWRDGGNRSRR